MDHMTPHSAGMTLPGWLTPLAWLFVGLAVIAAIAVAVDIYARGHRQRVRAMEAVWVLSALWLGPLTLPLYAKYGRPHSSTGQQAHPVGTNENLTGAAARGGLPGGAASLVAHVIGVPLVLATGLTIAGLDLYAMILLIAVLATALLFAFEVSVRSDRGRAGVALLVAAVTVLAFDIGMGGWMLLLHFNQLMPGPGEVTFLFLMQIGIALGFLTGYPAVAMLLKRGAKPAV